jgi:hypothetical protein
MNFIKKIKKLIMILFDLDENILVLTKILNVEKS